MLFEIGKYYKHSSGGMMHIVGEVKTTMYGKCLVAETTEHYDLKPVGRNKSATENWVESNEQEWMTNFS